MILTRASYDRLFIKPFFNINFDFDFYVLFNKDIIFFKKLIFIRVFRFSFNKNDLYSLNIF